MNVKEYLNNFFKGTKNPSLDAMKYFMNEYNDFEKEMKFIHVAGTNGKGSCVEMISNILVKQGYKVGKFISPHLIRYNERISINGIEITDDEIVKIIEELQSKIEQYNKTNNIPVTFFELETIMALLYFYREKVDFVILETGLGGLYDCTNIISKPLVSIISSIGYDHMHILGNTLEEIAYQKAGIVKKNSNTVIIEQEENVNDVFKKVCEERNNELHLISKTKIKNYKIDSTYQYFDYGKYKDIAIILKGKKQIENACLCIETINILNLLGYTVSEKAIREGLKTVIHKGRMETLSDNPLIIFDGAHNEPAIRNLKDMVEMYYNDKKVTYIISILKRKDYRKMIDILLQNSNAHFIFTSGNDIERYTSKDELYKYANSVNKDVDIDRMELNDAIEFAFNNKSKKSVFFVIGSFYVYGDVKEQVVRNLKQ